MPKAVLAGVAIVLLGGPSLVSAQRAHKPLPIEEVAGAKSFGLFTPSTLSPDGNWVAFTLIDSRRVPVLSIDSSEKDPAGSFGAGGDVWIANVATGENRNITGAKGNNWNATWSPDGKKLAFFSDRDGPASVWIWTRSTGQLRKTVARIGKPNGLAYPIWTPDGQKIVFPITPEAAAPGNAVATSGRTEMDNVLVYRSPLAAKRFGPVRPADTVGGQSMSFRVQYGIGVLDIASGSTKRLTTGERLGQYALSPDGRFVAAKFIKPSKVARSQKTWVDIVVLPVDGSPSKVLAKDVSVDYDAPFTWSPDGKQLAVMVGGIAPPLELWTIPVDGSSHKTVVLAGAKPDRGPYLPAWSADGKTILLTVQPQVYTISVAEGTVKPHAIPGKTVLGIVSPIGLGRITSPDNGKSALVLTRDSARLDQGIYGLDLTTGTATKLFEGAFAFGGYSFQTNIDVSRDGKRLSFVRESAGEPRDVWVSDLSLRDPKRITRSNPFYDTYALGRGELISWKGPDGEELHGALLLPPGHQPGQKHPVVVHVYAGSNLSKSLVNFGFGSGVPTENLQVLATRGFAVLLPDVPLGRGAPMRGIYEGVQRAVDRAIELGFVDSTRMGIFGQSYGGYSTLSTIVQTTRFRAAIDRAGPGNLVSFYGVFDEQGGNFGIGWSEEGQGRMDGTLWEMRNRYIENSPVFFLDRVETPLLIIHGTADGTVPVSETAQIFVGLRRLGKVVEYARYSGEGHWEGTWSYRNQVDYWNRVVRWMDAYLMASPTQ
jgi:dipeptidyl aminopeptidase/acylaminoacyl peptidase